MALTDGEKFKTAKRGKDRAIDSAHRHWGDKQKIDAVKTYMLLGGNAALSARTLGIPEPTFLHWKRSEWWKDVMEELRKEERIELSNKLKKVVDASWTVVADRLENGDFIYDQKTGEMRRKPVSLRDASKVAHDSVLLREKMVTSDNFTVAAEGIEQKLNALAKAFTDLSKGKKFEQPEDIAYVEQVGEEDAVYEGGEEGLQEGEPSLQLTASTEESPK